MSSQTLTQQCFTNQTVTASTWVNGPIERCDGYKTLVAEFEWEASVANSNNYVVAWYMDAGGTELVYQSQFGTGSTSFQSQSFTVQAPFYQLQAKNPDAVSHTLNAWGYLEPN